MVKIGQKFIIDTKLCQDVDLLEWYREQDNFILEVKEYDAEQMMIWVEDCPYGIEELEESIFLSENGEYIVNEIQSEFNRLEEEYKNRPTDDYWYVLWLGIADMITNRAYQEKDIDISKREVIDLIDVLLGVRYL